MRYLRMLLATIPCLAFLLAPALAQSDTMCFFESYETQGQRVRGSAERGD